MPTIPSAHQDTILSVAQIGQRQGEPNPYASQACGKCDGDRVRNHTMAIIVRSFMAASIARQIRCRRGGFIGYRGRRLCSGAGPELQHPVFAIRREWSLDRHESRSPQIAMRILARSESLSFGKGDISVMPERIGGNRAFTRCHTQEPGVRADARRAQVLGRRPII